MSERRGKKRPKSYYRKSAHSKRQKLNTLGVGMRGFLVTCNNNEKQAVRESYNILNEYADELYGPEQLQDKNVKDSDGSASDEEEEDMEKAMAKEVKALKEQQTETRRFQNTDTNAKNCIFIRTTLEDPTQLHHKIFSDLFEKKVSKARFAMRMLPIAGSCKAVLSEIKTLAEEILPKYFPSGSGEERTYSVIFKVRNNNGISRDTVLPMLGEIVKSLNPLNRVNCDNPDVAILVEVVCSICCIGVSTDFYKFRKCNLHEVVKDATKSAVDAGSKENVKKNKEMVSKSKGDDPVKLDVPGNKVDVPEDECNSESDVTGTVNQEIKADSCEETENGRAEQESESVRADQKMDNVGAAVEQQSGNGEQINMAVSSEGDSRPNCEEANSRKSAGGEKEEKL